MPTAKKISKVPVCLKENIPQSITDQSDSSDSEDNEDLCCICNKRMSPAVNLAFVLKFVSGHSVTNVNIGHTLNTAPK